MKRGGEKVENNDRNDIGSAEPHGEEERADEQGNGGGAAARRTMLLHLRVGENPAGIKSTAKEPTGYDSPRLACDLSPHHPRALMKTPPRQPQGERVQRGRANTAGAHGSSHQRSSRVDHRCISHNASPSLLITAYALEKSRSSSVTSTTGDSHLAHTIGSAALSCTFLHVLPRVAPHRSPNTLHCCGHPCLILR